MRFWPWDANHDYTIKVDSFERAGHRHYFWELLHHETDKVRALSPLPGWDTEEEAKADCEALLDAIGADHLESA